MTTDTASSGALVRYRPKSPALRDDRADRPLAGHLPANLLNDDFVARFVRIFEDVYSTVTSHADGLEHLADPSVTPARMLEGWLRILALDGVTEGRPDFTMKQRRRLLESAGLIIGQRGTLPGLAGFLALAIGHDSDVPIVIRSSDSSVRVNLDGRDDAVIRVSDNGGVYRAGDAVRGRTKHPKVTVALPHTAGFRPADLIELVRGELPANVMVSIAIESATHSTVIYDGPAIGSAKGF